MKRYSWTQLGNAHVPGRKGNTDSIEPVVVGAKTSSSDLEASHEQHFRPHGRGLNAYMLQLRFGHCYRLANHLYIATVTFSLKFFAIDISLLAR